MLTESIASSFMPVERMNCRSSGFIGWICFPQPRSKISEKRKFHKCKPKPCQKVAQVAVFKQDLYFFIGRGAVNIQSVQQDNKGYIKGSQFTFVYSIIPGAKECSHQNSRTRDSVSHDSNPLRKNREGTEKGKQLIENDININRAN